MKFHVWEFYSDNDGGNRNSYAQVEAGSLEEVEAWVRTKFVDEVVIDKDGDGFISIISTTFHACEEGDPDCPGIDECDNWMTVGFQIEPVERFVYYHAPVVVL